MPRATHFFNLLNVTRCIYPQNLDGNILAMVFDFPHIRKLATAQWVRRWVVRVRVCQ
jgi:hypothetical protein